MECVLDNSGNINFFSWKTMKSIKSILKDHKPEDKGKYVTREFQDYGLRLSQKLGDEKHKSLYIKLAKTVDRGILEEALTFVMDAHEPRSRARLFMWKMKELKK